MKIRKCCYSLSETHARPQFGPYLVGNVSLIGGLGLMLLGCDLWAFIGMDTGGSKIDLLCLAISDACVAHHTMEDIEHVCLAHVVADIG